MRDTNARSVVSQSFTEKERRCLLYDVRDMIIILALDASARVKRARALISYIYITRECREKKNFFSRKKITSRYLFQRRAFFFWHRVLIFVFPMEWKVECKLEYNNEQRRERSI